MALVHIAGLVTGVSSLPTNQLVSLIEDPNPTNNRLFLSSQAHDGTYLTPVFGQNFHYSSPAPTYSVNPMPANNTNFAYGGHISTQKASINCYAGVNSTNGDADSNTAFHRSLDPVNYPAKRAWYTVNNRVVFGYPNSANIADATTVGNNIWQIYTSDITQGYLYQSSAQTYAPNNIFYEDSINNKIWGLACGGGYQESICYVANYDNPATVTFNNVENGVRLRKYFLGPDIANNTYWVEHGFSANDPYYVYKFTPGGTPVATTLLTGIVTNGPNANIYNSRPSNIRIDSAASRVFYSSHFDSMGEFRPIRFQWDPTNTTGIVTATTCTMVYGVGTGSNYMRPCVITAQTTNNADNWHYKGWQFKPTGSTTTYLTFWPSDRSTFSTISGTGPNNTVTRWPNPINRTMMTYSINTSTDSYNTGSAILTYHSSYIFPSVPEMPRDWLPIVQDGTQMAVPVTGKVNFFTFNPLLGWGLTNSYPFEMRMLGLDAQNRLWGTSVEVGNIAVHLLTPTVPYTVSVVMPTQSYTYTGTNILTTATLYAYDQGGNQVSVPANLSINGGSMLFTDNGTINLTTTTSATAGVNLNLTITGGGVNNIIVGATL
jgi:hypothetical protein